MRIRVARNGFIFANKRWIVGLPSLLLAELISEKLGLPHISSGDIFRENLKNETELGRLAAQFINKGELVPDDGTIAMIKERLTRPDCQLGALLDGFPRTPVQAQALDELLKDLQGEVKVVPYIRVDEDVLIERLTGRWTCLAQGHVYHEKYNPPQQDGICDIDGSDLCQREDDKPEIVKRRIRVYFEQTRPLIAYYQAKGVLHEIDGAQAIEQVTAAMLAVLPVGKSHLLQACVCAALETQRSAIYAQGCVPA